jgi:hypothetical protein
MRSPSPTPSPLSGGAEGLSPRGRQDRWNGRRGSDSDETPRSYRNALAGELSPPSAPAAVVPLELRSEVCVEESTAIDALAGSDDALEEEDGGDAAWEELAHVLRKKASCGRRAGKKVASRSRASAMGSDRVEAILGRRLAMRNI